MRGIGNFLLAALRRHEKNHVSDDSVTRRAVHFYSSSGGNAGLACVHSAVALGCPATIVVPLSTTPFMVAKLHAAGASDVIQRGETWAEADKYLKQEIMVNITADDNELPVYVPPFDAQDIWDGNATIVPELLHQLKRMDDVEKSETSSRLLADVVICSVGGGGLFCGICQSIDEAGLSSTVQVIAMETAGADSLSQAVERRELVTLPRITSIATSLGARTVCSKALEYGLRDMVTTQVVTDATAINACRKFADEQKLLVEPACGVCLAPIFNGTLRKMVPTLKTDSNVVVVVCGGSNISLDILADYVEKYSHEIDNLD
jgi:L-serine/L-threonine ammonia-lyase